MLYIKITYNKLNNMIYISCDKIEDKIENQLKQLCVLLEHVKINNSRILFSNTMYNNLKIKLGDTLILDDDIYNKTKKIIIPENRINEIYNIISEETLKKIVDIIYIDKKSMYDAYDLLVDIRKYFKDEDDDNYICVYGNLKNFNNKHAIIFYDDDNIEKWTNYYYIKYDNSMTHIFLMTFYKYTYIENKCLEKWINFLALYKN